MPSKKKKYNARFPAGRIKKIMQTDEEVGKVAQAVPIIISRTLELFVESLIKKSMEITLMKNARTLSPHHMKLCILSESRFDFLRELVKGVPEVTSSDDDIGSTLENQTLPSQHVLERRTSKGTQGDVPPFPNFYTEKCDDSPSGRDVPPSSSSGIENQRWPSSQNDNLLRSDEDDDTDTQSSNGSALVVNTVPENYGTSHTSNPDDEDYDT